MRKKINLEFLKQNQKRAQSFNNQLQNQLYTLSYELIKDNLEDIKKPFFNVCIHGYYPHLILKFLQYQKYKNQQFANFSVDKDKFSKISNSLKPKLTIIDYLNLIQPTTMQNQTYQIQIIRLQKLEELMLEQEKFDLIISCLQWNHVNSQQILLKSYLNSLTSDGALVGTVITQGTLSELNWCYLMGQNQRYGGISPKIANFPSAGTIGNALTTANYQISTILSKQYTLQFQNPLDLIKAIQIIGQSGYLRGRRKAIYKDLLLSIYALYQSEFSQTCQKKQKIISNLVISSFIGWKYSQNQIKPLRRGQVPKDLNLIQELKRQGEYYEHYIIKQDSQYAQKFIGNQLKQSQKKTQGKNQQSKNQEKQKSSQKQK